MTPTDIPAPDRASNPSESPPLPATDYLNAARVPTSLQPQEFGEWRLVRCPLPVDARNALPWETITILKHPKQPDWSNIHLADDDGQVLDVVMEDSPRELRRHLPIWMNARGRVLITGLGLGCVVRGLLASPNVEHIDVVEIDPDILRVIGAEFAKNPRVTLHWGDALTIEFHEVERWDYAWHDLWTDGDRHLQSLHAELLLRFKRHVRFQQGAWAFPRALGKYYGRVYPLLGMPKVRRAA